jgi:hypothetical protein
MTEQDEQAYDKTVSFGELTIIEFPIMLGDNPAVSSGAPIQLGPKPLSTQTRNLEIYEYIRKDTRRHRKHLLLSVPRRAGLLFAAGYTLDQIGKATLQVQTIKSQREDSVNKSSGWTVGGLLAFPFRKIAKQRTVPARTA